MQGWGGKERTFDFDISIATIRDQFSVTLSVPWYSNVRDTRTYFSEVVGFPPVGGNFVNVFRAEYLPNCGEPFPGPESTEKPKVLGCTSSYINVGSVYKTFWR